jgi:hypothetical protein
MEIGIGRPSTIPYHSLKISKQYLNATGALNYAGLSSINKALETAPLMLSIERIHEVDRLLLAGSEVSSTIYNSFHSVGITKELLFKQRTGGNRMRDNIFSEFSID